MKVKTPVCDFVKQYRDSNAVRFHMPGHKGKNALGCEELDITEIDGADELFAPEGIIKQSEAEASLIFGCPTYYSAAGSTAAIQAMLHLIASYAVSMGEKPLILAARNAHRAFVNAAMLLKIDIEWLYSDNRESYHSCIIGADSAAAAIKKAKRKVTAVYLTSPDYLGNIADIKAISRVCRDNRVLLAVDGAHGAYLKFMPEDMHPITLGADICCTSAHKTLPVLTGGAYLHISSNLPLFFIKNAKASMALFSSSSPSYLILQSLDMMNARAERFKKDLTEVIPKAEKFKNTLKTNGYKLIGNEMIKVTIMPKSYGYYGNEIAEILMKNGIYPEFYDRDFVVLMLSPYNRDDELEHAAGMLCKIERRSAINESAPAVVKAKKAYEPYEILLKESEELPIDDCLGRVCALSVISCPPAIPIAVCGEIIDEKIIEIFKYYDIDKCAVIKND